ncbi:hypothetical protein CSHISOI_11539, partial [Colletotrichum shisoi]
LPLRARHHGAHLLAPRLRAQGARGRLRRPRRVGQRRQGARPVSQGRLQRRGGCLLPGADPQCRRAHDDVLQVHDLRKSVERKLIWRREVDHFTVHCEALGGEVWVYLVSFDIRDL